MLSSIFILFVPFAPLSVYLLTAVTFSFLGGWVEENIYRGYFVKAFEGKMSRVPACLLQALLFAFGRAHYSYKSYRQLNYWCKLAKRENHVRINGRKTLPQVRYHNEVWFYS